MSNVAVGTAVHTPTWIVQFVVHVSAYLSGRITRSARAGIPVGDSGPQWQTLCTYRWRLDMLAAEAAAQTSGCAEKSFVAVTLGGAEQG